MNKYGPKQKVSATFKTVNKTATNQTTHIELALRQSKKIERNFRGVTCKEFDEVKAKSLNDPPVCFTGMSLEPTIF